MAGGAATRFGRPKQFEPLGDATVLEQSVRVAAEVSEGVVAVVPDDETVNLATVVGRGGSSRSESVRRGLASVPGDAEVIVVHDAARPLATVQLFRAVIDAVMDGADGAVPGVSVLDTLRDRDGGVADRERFVAVQTPQAFRADRLRAAHLSNPEATDDASVVEAGGGTVVVVPGERWNLKITEPADLIVAATLWEARR